MYELKKVGAKTSARVTSFVFAILYLIFGVLSLVTGSTAIGSGLISLLVGFVLFALFGGLFGLLVAWFYNFAAKHWGGMHVDFELIDEDEKKDQPHDAGPTGEQKSSATSTPQY